MFDLLTRAHAEPTQDRQGRRPPEQAAREEEHAGRERRSRAPGSDGLTARALRRSQGADEADAFPQDVVELMAYFRGAAGPVKAVPGMGLHVPIWILGSSLFGAQLAAALGLPYSFASHFAPAQMMQAIEIYRAQFQPSDQLDRPYVMLGFNVFAADTDAADCLS